MSKFIFTTILLLLSVHEIISQAIPFKNSSFEEIVHSVDDPYKDQPCAWRGTWGQKYNPLDWCRCPRPDNFGQYLNTPNLQPGDITYRQIASEGQYFVVMVCRRDSTFEWIGQEISPSIQADKQYFFTLSLCSFLSATTRFFHNRPAKLRVWGGNSQCEFNELLWESPLIDHSSWKNYIARIQPTQSYSYLTFQAQWNTTTSEYDGNVAMDRLSDINLDYFPEKEEDTVYICKGSTLEWNPDWDLRHIEAYDLTSGERLSFPMYFDSDGLNLLSLKDKNIEGYQRTFKLTTIVVDTPWVVVNQRDTSLCLGDEIELKAFAFRDNFRVDPDISFEWTDGLEDFKRTVNSPGLYSIIGSNENCHDTASVKIDYIDCEHFIELPNIFTPNGDGINDTFGPISWKGISDYQLVIFDRWGRKMFESSAISGRWNGFTLDKVADAGVYYFVAKYSDPLNQAHMQKGSISLLR